MTKTLVALGAAAAIGAAAFITSAPATAQYRVARVGFVGAVASPYYYGNGSCYEPRGLFTYSYTNNCGCGSFGYPHYGAPAEPYGHSYYQEQQYTHPYYRGVIRPYYRRHALYLQHRPYVRAHYRAHHRNW